MLKLNNVTKIYKTKDFSIGALSGASLTLPDVGFISILGDSGSGKTTLLNLIGGLDKVSSGDIYFNNENITLYDDLKLTEYRKKHIGFIFQNFGLIPYVNVYQNVKVSCDLLNEDDSCNEKINNILNKVGLFDKAKKYPKELSGGEKQRVAIARALINSPSIILADEPTGQLDKTNSLEILKLLKSISSSYLVIMVTHNEEFAKTFSDRIIILEDGKIIKDSILNEKISKNCKVFEKSNKKCKHIKIRNLFSLQFFRSFKHKLKLILTSLSFAIGLGGLSLCLALNNGANSYINNLETTTLIRYPITIEDISFNGLDISDYFKDDEEGIYPDYQYLNVSNNNYITHINLINDRYLNYLNNLSTNLYDSISYRNKVNMNLITNDNGIYKGFINSPTNFTSDVISNTNYFNSLTNYEKTINEFDVISGRLPQNRNELVLVTDKYNNIPNNLLTNIGITTSNEKLNFSDIIGKKYKLVNNNDFYSDSNIYKEVNGIFLKESYLFKENDLSIYTLYDLIIDLNNNYQNEMYDKVKENLKEIIKYIDIPNGVDIDIDSIDFSNEDEILDFISSIHQRKTITYFNNPDTNRLKEIYNDKFIGEELEIVGIIRPNENSYISSYSPGLYYLEELKDYVINFNNLEVNDINNDGIINELDDTRNKVTKEYEKAFYLNYDGRLNYNFLNIIDNNDLNNDYLTYLNNRKVYGLDNYISNILIYPKDYDSKIEILNYLDEYNTNLDTKDVITYIDLSGDIMDSVHQIINFLSIILISLSSISLLISIIMIIVITFNSINERTYEFGVLRSLGARKIDIGNLVIIESIFISILSSLIGLLISYIMTYPLNNILNGVFGNLLLYNVVSVDILNILLIIGISSFLVIIASLIPAIQASKKKPIDALKAIE